MPFKDVIAACGNHVVHIQAVLSPSGDEGFTVTAQSRYPPSTYYLEDGPSNLKLSGTD